jgi:AcrR family transcriptional regulator
MPTVASKQGSRSKILNAAAEEFAASGFAGARIDRISRRTRLNVRMIYYHFGSKRGLYRAVLQHIYEQMSRIVNESEQNQNAALTALGLYFDLLTDNPRFADVLVRELLDGARHLKALSKERPELFHKVHLHARQLIAQGVRDGELRDVDPAATMLTITSMVCFLTAVRDSHSLFLDGRELGRDDWKRYLFGLIIEGIRSKAPYGSG